MLRDTNLFNYPVGTVVYSDKDFPIESFGHVVGFTQNVSTTPETILLVKFENLADPVGIHPGNVYTKRQMEIALGRI